VATNTSLDLEGVIAQIRTALAGKLILCVSDSAIVLERRKIVFSAFQSKMITADGARAIEAVKSQPVDAAIVDYRRPDSKGELVVIGIKVVRPTLPLAVIAEDAASIPASVFKLADAFLERSASSTELLLLTARMLERSYESAA
jgi:DNA-binding NtrC family response regulator